MDEGHFQIQNELLRSLKHNTCGKCNEREVSKIICTLDNSPDNAEASRKETPILSSSNILPFASSEVKMANEIPNTTMTHVNVIKIVTAVARSVAVCSVETSFLESAE